MSDRSYIDKNNKVLDSFFKNVEFYTKPDTRIVVMYPQTHESALKKHAERYGFKLNILTQKKHILYKNITIYKTVKK